MTVDPSPATDSDSFSERPVASALSGCLYATIIILVSAGMLLINAILCLAIQPALPKFGNEELSARIGQLFFFVAPLVLLFIEWNLLDRLQRLFSSRN